MSDLDDRITVAARHVEEARQIVIRQRERIASGKAGAEAEVLLKTFEQSLAIFEGDLARLRSERDGKSKGVSAE